MKGEQTPFAMEPLGRDCLVCKKTQKKKSPLDGLTVIAYAIKEDYVRTNLTPRLLVWVTVRKTICNGGIK